jgi:uncharacterized membrane protein
LSFNLFPIQNSHTLIDMAISLPAFVLGAVYLWRRKPIGYGLGGSLLTFVVLIMVSLLSMFAVQAQHGLTVTTADIAVISTVAVAYMALLVWFLSGLGAAAASARKLAK